MSKVAKRLLGLLISFLILYVILMPKFDWMRFWESSEPAIEAGPSQGRDQRLLVSAIITEPTLLENSITITGGIIPNESVEIKSEISGKVDAIRFKEGTNVRKGDLLVKINVDDLLAQRQKARYTEELREDIEFRQRQLLEREAISQEEYDQSLTELQTARADIDLLETQIDKSYVRAPFNGMVGLRNISLGAYITPSSIITDLSSIDPVKIEFSIPGKYSNRIKEGSKISFTTDASEQVYMGTVYAREPRIDPNTRTLKVRAISANPGGGLLPGQFVRIELNLDRKENVLMVPTEAVVPELNSSKVFVLNNGIISEKKIETGIRTATHLEVTSGLNHGDTVITTGILQVRIGMPVKVSL
jgi:membrane fusion protein (multidrug efflux system)